MGDIILTLLGRKPVELAPQTIDEYAVIEAARIFRRKLREENSLRKIRENENFCSCKQPDMTDDNSDV